MTWPLKGYPFGTEGSGVVSPIGAKVRVVRLLIRADVRSVRRLWSSMMQSRAATAIGQTLKRAWDQATSPRSRPALRLGKLRSARVTRNDGVWRG